MASCRSDLALSRRSAVRLTSAGLVAALATKASGSAEARDLSTLEANKAIVRRVFDESINGRTVAAVNELFAPEFVDRGAASRQMPGPAGMPLTIDEFHALVPDVYVTVDAIIAEGDFVATRETWHGAHPPIGMHVVGRTMHFFRIGSGQIIEEWSVGWEWIESLRGRPPSANPLIVARG